MWNGYGNDGAECPSLCPAVCGEEEIMCSGGKYGNDCQMPDFCMAKKSRINSIL